jgi:uncharacterized membrane protein YgcG
MTLSGQTIRGRMHLVLAVSILGLGLGGVALAQHSSRSVSANVTLMDGKIKLSQTTFAPGSLTFVVVNQGKLTHALAVMGTGLQPKRTPTLSTGKSARLTVTFRAGGKYHVWDPVQSSMSHATMLMVKKAITSGGTTSGGGTSGGTTSGGTTSGGSSGGSPSAGPGVNPPDPCEGMGGMGGM